MQVPQVLLDLDADEAGGRTAGRPASGGPVWKEHHGDWEEGDSVLADLAGAGLGVAASEETSFDDPFAYDFISDDTGEHRAVGATDTGEHRAERSGHTGEHRVVPPAGAPAPDEVLAAASAPAAEAAPGPDRSPTPAADGDDRPHELELEPDAGEEAASAASAAPRARHRAAHRARAMRPGADRAEAPAGGPAPSSLAARIAAGPAAARGQGRRDPVVATVTGLGVAAVALVCFAVGPVASLVLVVVVGTLAGAELFGGLRTAGYRPATLVGLAAIPVAVVTAYLFGPTALVVTAAAVFVLTMLWFILGVGRREPVVNSSVTLMAFTWVGVLGGFAGLLLDPKAFPNHAGIALLIGAILVAVAYDVGGYAFGSWIGKRKLAPVVSPNKTWEGLLGGCFTAVAIAVAAVSNIHPWTLDTALVLGLCVAVVAPIGDLAESLVKRDLGVKDMGSILPGHGGVLDRVDALLFVLPIAYCVAKVAHLG